MERLTKNNGNGDYYYPKCFEKCDGLGASSKCDNCEITKEACKKLGRYEDLEEQGGLIKLPCMVVKMNDLISRKSVMRLLHDLRIDNMQVNGKSILTHIREIPTAINVNRVIGNLNAEADASCENFDKYAREVAICENENTFSAGLIRAVEIIRECEEDGNG